MEASQELQDLYSSTSSDDQSSINSVVHVGGTLDTSESDGSAPPTPRRHRVHHAAVGTEDEDDDLGHQMDDDDDDDDDDDEDSLMENLQGNHARGLLCGDDVSTTDSDDDVEERLRRAEEGREGDSDTDSTSSEETQM